MHKIFKISIAKTLWFNLKYLGLGGLKLPVLVSRDTKLKKMGGQVKILNPQFGGIKLGFNSVGFISSKVSAK